MGARTTARIAPDARFRGAEERLPTPADDRFAALPDDVERLPLLPPEFGAALDDGLLALGVSLTADARRTIEGHVRLLLAWNPAINLTSIVDPAAIATRHVLDSLAALPFLVPAGADAERSGLAILDVGSGGGFPGLPLAAAIPSARVELADSIAKKARFLTTAVAATGLADRVWVAARRAEELPDRGSRDIVTARAVGALPDLVELSLPLLRIGGRLLAWKRGDIDEELRAADRAAAGLGGSAAVVHRIDRVPDLEGHVLVEITKLRRTPDGYPRDPARRARQPW